MQYSTCTLQSHITASGAGGSGARVLAAGDWAADGGAGGGADENYFLAEFFNYLCYYILFQWVWHTCLYKVVMFLSQDSVILCLIMFFILCLTMSMIEIKLHEK